MTLGDIEIKDSLTRVTGNNSFVDSALVVSLYGELPNLARPTEHSSASPIAQALVEPKSLVLADFPIQNWQYHPARSWADSATAVPDYRPVVPEFDLQNAIKRSLFLGVFCTAAHAIARFGSPLKSIGCGVGAGLGTFAYLKYEGSK